MPNTTVGYTINFETQPKFMKIEEVKAVFKRPSADYAVLSILAPYAKILAPKLSICKWIWSFKVFRGLGAFAW